MQPSTEVLAERIRILEREINDIKKELKDQSQDLESLPLILHRLNNIENSLQGITTTLSKDTGWRGFFIDFIKAAAQIAALVGAGKFIF